MTGNLTPGGDMLFPDPIQHDYEAIRPVVLFGQAIADRSQESNLERTTVGDKAWRFITGGCLAWYTNEANDLDGKDMSVPNQLPIYSLLEITLSPIHYREFVRILWRKIGYKVDHHTIKSFLVRSPMPIQLELEIKTFQEFENAYEARW